MQSSPLLLEVCSPLSRKWLVCYILFEDVNERLLRTNAMRVFVTQTNRRVGGPQRRDRSHADLEMSHTTLNVGSGKIKHI